MTLREDLARWEVEQLREDLQVTAAAIEQAVWREAEHEVAITVSLDDEALTDRAPADWLDTDRDGRYSTTVTCWDDIEQLRQFFERLWGIDL